MNRLLVFLATSLLVGTAHADTMIQNYAAHGTPATSSDKLVTLDDSTVTKVRNLAFTGVGTDVLAGDGSWLDTTTLLDAESDPVFLAWDKDYADLINTPTIPDVTNYISKTNTTPYTPTADYHPATKGYVDATVVGEGGYVAGTGIDITDGVISSTVVDTDTDSFVDYSVTTTVGDPGTDTNVPSEQAVREAIAAAGLTDGTAVGDIPVWDGTSYEPLTPINGTIGHPVIWEDDGLGNASIPIDTMAEAGAAAYLDATPGVIGDVVTWVDDGLGNASIPISVPTDIGDLTDSGGLLSSGDAAEVGVEDTDGNFTGTDVETVLAELAEGIAAVWDRIALAGWDNPLPTYSLTLSVVDSGSITINSTEYTSTSSPHTITGLTGATTMTAEYGGTNDTLTWGGTDVADISGSYPTYSITMDEAKSISATFSTASTGPAIEDDFSTNTASDYTDIVANQGVEVVSGKAEMEGNNWTKGMAYYSGTGADLGSDEHYVQGRLSFGSASSKAAGRLLLRVDADGTSSTGYVVYPNYSNSPAVNMYISKFSGSTETYVTFVDFTGDEEWGANETYLVRVSVNSSDQFEIEIDWNDDGDFSDTNESDMTVRTDTSYTGNYIGLGWYDNGEAASVDDFSGDTL